VDAIWIENMNTVLDDNKKLCLVSGEVIALSKTMTMMFEVDNLAVASPATVSRCGMVYMEPSALGLRPLADSWLQSLPGLYAAHNTLLLSLFEALVPPLIELVRKQLQETVSTVDGNLCLGCFKIFGSLSEDVKGPGGLQSGAADPSDVAAAKEKVAALVVPLFVFSVIWSIGGSCDKASRPAFDKALRDLLSKSGCASYSLHTCTMTA
jgi:dynein heavy chain, axonemal